ncbi:metallopeptidase TldD-related protein [Bacillus sp. CH30_1T]|uniref:metallopeptidase TldD-related protein n=1 Tax=Bacillus sp. CH30_1T TaxID=2604836 RepID=UPI00165E96AE|nr:metallopeptidase TldD-related protein [Bacillus sp. CH30_1T]
MNTEILDFLHKVNLKSLELKLKDVKIFAKHSLEKEYEVDLINQNELSYTESDENEFLIKVLNTSEEVRTFYTSSKEFDIIQTFLIDSVRLSRQYDSHCTNDFSYDDYVSLKKREKLEDLNKQQLLRRFLEVKEKLNALYPQITILNAKYYHLLSEHYSSNLHEGCKVQQQSIYGFLIHVKYHTIEKSFISYSKENPFGILLDSLIINFNRLKKRAGLIAKNEINGVYNTILLNTAAAKILSSFSSVFFADTVEGKYLTKSLGEKVASDLINIYDDPTCNEGLVNSIFDFEGNYSQQVVLVKNGFLNNLLHNNETAKLFETYSNGHGYRENLESNIRVSSTNMYIKKGKTSIKKMMKNLHTGIVLDTIYATNSGIDLITGDFSVLADGYFKRSNGEKLRLDGVLVSGNFLELLNGVEDISDDFCYDNSSLINGCFGSPSLLVNKLKVSINN